VVARAAVVALDLPGGNPLGKLETVVHGLVAWEQIPSNDQDRMTIRAVIAMAAAAVAVLFSSCSSTTNLASAKTYETKTYRTKTGKQIDNAKYYVVKTTAYSHVEADSLKYGKGSAAGGTLKYGSVRSAASDWSVFPLGTVFKIQGLPYIYQVDDYGSALVGTKTIDLYKPDFDGIKKWGARKVKIQVLRWGSYERSLAILKDRMKHPHVREMAVGIQQKMKSSGRS
jgi:3D (Asp-Asp-Asp) domain-containing protein